MEPVAEKFSVCQGQRGAIETKDVKSGSNIIDKPGSVFVILIDMFEIQPLPKQGLIICSVHANKLQPSVWRPFERLKSKGRGRRE